MRSDWIDLGWIVGTIMVVTLIVCICFVNKHAKGRVTSTRVESTDVTSDKSGDDDLG